MLKAKPTVFISHSEAAKAAVARPFQEFVESRGLHGVLVGEEPLPDAGAGDPRSKVYYFLNHSQMFVALMTPDSELVDGKVQTRQNIILEIGAALERPHLKDRVLVFHAPNVELPSNINPVYRPLDPDNVSASFSDFEKQARVWQLLDSTPEESAPVRPSSPDAELPREEDANPASVAQAAAALSHLAGLLSGSDVEEDEPTIARAFLAASTALALIRSSEPLGVHEMNGLYRDRKSIVPTTAERSHILRAVLVNIGAANAPGWYWLRHESAAGIRAQVSAVALNESDSHAVREAIKLLINADAGPSRGELRAIVRHALSYDNGANADSALELLKSHGTRTDLRALRAELDAHPRQDPVAAVRLAIQSRESPTAALRALLDSPTHLDPLTEGNLLAGAATLHQTKIRAALDSTAAPLRQLSLRLLDATSTLRKTDVIDVIEGDEEGLVRILAAELAVKRRWRLSRDQFEKALKDAPWSFDRQQLGVRFTALRPAAELTESLAWFRNTSYWIYEALGRHHFALIKDRIATDLETDFARLREEDRRGFVEIVKVEVEADFKRKFKSAPPEESSERIEQMVQASLKKYLESWSELDDFMLKRFRIAVLSALAANPAPEHARWGRQYLKASNRELALKAIEVVRLCGDPDDVAALSSVVAGPRGEQRPAAAAAALELSEDRRETALAFLETDDAEVVRLALAALQGSPFDKEMVEAIWPLLRNEHQSIRNAATEHLIAELPKKQLRVLPDAYSQGQYYYNVVTLVDRALYAPGWVRQSARRILGD
jgi:hypothetical protein